MGPALEGVGTLIHLASETGVQPSVEDPVTDFEGNLATTFRVLEASRSAGVERFVFASTGAAAGEVEGAIHEEVVPKPLSPYGAGKLGGEALAHAYAASFGMGTASLRFSNVYGPFSLHKKWNAVPSFIKRCLAGESLTIYGDGGQTRDFVYVEDLCAAIHRAATTDGIAGEVFQVATGVETSILDLAELVKKVTGADVDVEFGPRREGEVYRTSVDISKARRVLGYEPAVSLEEGIGRTANWYREHWRPE
jgi:UDP-glucose 4-epimerase